jgi:hypothetical protein
MPGGGHLKAGAIPEGRPYKGDYLFRTVDYRRMDPAAGIGEKPYLSSFVRLMRL